MNTAASHSASITGTVQFGPTLNREANSSSTVLASTMAAEALPQGSACHAVTFFLSSRVIRPAWMKGAIRLTLCSTGAKP